MKKYIGCVLLLVMGCDGSPWNNPYPYDNPKGNIVYSAFSERPNHLDPARSYTSSEWPLLCQIVEPPLEYNYLKRPYVLEPLTALQMPTVRYYNKDDQEISAQGTIAYSVYEISIRSGIYYAPHPAFVKNTDGTFKYHDLPYQEAKKYRRLSDFTEKSTKELTAEDYIYQIKRLAEPSLNSPIYGMMSRYIEGLVDLRTQLAKTQMVEQDLREYGLKGVELVDRYTYRIRIQGDYPQFRFWLAMPFFAPIPWEVAHFYAQPVLQAHNISLDEYPVGTGPYCLEENNPERRMVLMRNAVYRQGQDNIIKPTVDKVIYTLEKESVPYWNKFLQGYYDGAGIQSDNFSSVIRFDEAGGVGLTESMQAKDVQLQISVSSGIFSWSFNMLDSTVGGYTERARKIRQAISMAFNVQEFIDIFLNGRGIRAFGPIPEDIFGFEAQKKIPSRNIILAKQLLQEAGYPKGLTLYFDSYGTGSPDDVAIHQWLIKQFSAINVQVVFRNTDYNRFQEKVRSGTAQVFFWGWNADYPDPENFLFLFYGPNSSALSGGENTANYSNPVYDQLFERMRSLENGPERFKLIQAMVDILQKDAPWVWGFYPKTFSLYHGWMQAAKPSSIMHNTLKYVRINPLKRAEKRILWNQPMIWPLGILGLCVVLGIFWVTVRLRKNRIGMGGGI